MPYFNSETIYYKIDKNGSKFCRYKFNKTTETDTSKSLTVMAQKVVLCQLVSSITRERKCCDVFQTTLTTTMTTRRRTRAGRRHRPFRRSAAGSEIGEDFISPTVRTASRQGEHKCYQFCLITLFFLLILSLNSCSKAQETETKFHIVETLLRVILSICFK